MFMNTRSIHVILANDILAPGESRTFETRIYKAFKPERLYGLTKSDASLMSVKIGTKEQLPPSSAIPLFTMREGIDVAWDIIHSLTDVSTTLHNSTASPQPVRVEVIGPPIDDNT